MQSPPQGAGYFRAPKKLETKEQVIARVCAYLEESLGKKRVENRTPEEIQQAEDDYWTEKLLRRYEAKLWHDNFMASFQPQYEACGPKLPSRNRYGQIDYFGRGGAVRSE